VTLPARVMFGGQVSTSCPIASMLAPKGLAAAVLVSIALCAVLIMAFSARPVQSLYAVMLGKRPSTGATDAQ